MIHSSRMLDSVDRHVFNDEHRSFRDTVRKFFEKHLYPHLDRWEQEGVVEREFWKACGEAGLLAPGVPADYGGLGLDYGFNAVVNEEVSYAGATLGIGIQSDIVADYIINFGSEQQKHRWLPPMVSGDIITAIAMTEPSTGSDLKAVRTTARRDGDEYVVSGSKTYISNGQMADLAIVVAKTDVKAGAKGISLILVEANRLGYRRGRNLDKIGQRAGDTSELFFDDVRVPIANCLGLENEGFAYLMQQLPQERLSIAIAAQANAQRAFDEAVIFTKGRPAFGKTVFDFQNTRFTLASLQSKLQVGWSHIDWALGRHLAKRLTAAEASAAKLWHTELQWEICDASLQLHGGAGYMNEYPIARLWRDARVFRIYGGSNEIMKELIGRSV
jgi:acyl-CoA dehydrogenase